jgi:hypothetical protein
MLAHTGKPAAIGDELRARAVGGLVSAYDHPGSVFHREPDSCFTHALGAAGDDGGLAL